MQHKKTIVLLVISIGVLSLLACLAGVFAIGGEHVHEYQSIRGEIVKIHGKGIYQYDSVAVVAQGIAQDIVTIFLGIPLLLSSLYVTIKGSLKGKLLLTGTLGYFLYTYISYTFYWTFNPLFLLYVIIMSASFFAFILIMMSFDLEKISEAFHKETPIKFLGGFQIFLGFAVGMLWLGKIVPTISTGSVPQGLEHYTTLVIQGMDLGFVVPIAFVSGILLIKRRPFGYLLSSIVIMKGLTMGTALTAMVIGQKLAGVEMSLIEMAMFPLFNLILFYSLFLLLKSIKKGS